MSTPTITPRTILITGATGKQGRAVLASLLSLSTPSAPLHLLAVTRNPTSSSAKALAALPSVTLIAGDLSSPSSLFISSPSPIWGVYSVQINSDAETTQGKSLIDAALAHNVHHFVYSSGDRGGPEKSSHDATNVKNFAAKFAIEKYLEAECASSAAAAKEDASRTEMTYTVLRPVTFFDNQTTDRHGAGFARMWEQIGKPLQMIAVRDIGWFAAQAFVRADEEGYRNRALTLAGDELTAVEAGRIFKEVTGKEMAMAPCPVGSMVKFFLKDTVGDMFRWFETDGYGADVKACRAQNPTMLDYRAWLSQESAWKKA